MLFGDFNSDFFRSYEGVNSYAGKKLEDILQQFNYCVMNDRNLPTRVTSGTQTLMDLVISSKPDIIKGATKQLSWESQIMSWFLLQYGPK